MNTDGLTALIRRGAVSSRRRGQNASSAPTAIDAAEMLRQTLTGSALTRPAFRAFPSCAARCPARTES